MLLILQIQLNYFFQLSLILPFDLVSCLQCVAFIYLFIYF